MSVPSASIVKRLRDDPVFFAEKVMKWAPYPYQRDLLQCKSRRIVAVWGRQSGKTTCIAVKVIHFVFTHSKKTVLIVSKGLRQSMIMYSVISTLILENPILRRAIVRYTRTQIILSNGSKVIALPCSRDGANLRGYTAHIVIMDEAAFMPETVIANVIFPMLATTNGVAIMLSTPWGRSHIFYRSFIDPNFWTQKVKSSQCPKITKDFLDEQKRLIGDLRYRIEYEAEFVEDQNAFFPQDLIRGALEDEDYELLTDQEILMGPKRTGIYYLGGDLGKRVDYSSLMIFKEIRRKIITKDSSGFAEIDPRTGEMAIEIVHPSYKLIWMKKFPLKTKLTEVSNWMEILYGKFENLQGCFDQTGIGEQTAERMSDKCPNINGVFLSAQTKQDVMQYLYTRMEQYRLIIPMLREVITEMNEQMYGFGHARERIQITPEERGVMQFWHPEGRHDDQLWALALGIFATKHLRSKGVVIGAGR